MFFAQITGGSTSIAEFVGSLAASRRRRRALLFAAAGEEWWGRASSAKAKSEVAKFSVQRNGHTYFVNDSRSGKRVSFGDVADQAGRLKKSGVHPKGRPKDPSQYRVLGKFTRPGTDKPMPRVDAWDKVTGRAKYGIDTTAEIAGAPAMLNCAIIRCPVAGGKLAAYAPQDPKAVGAIYLLPLKGGLAVIAPTFWQALNASRKFQNQGSPENLGQANHYVRWNTGGVPRQNTEELKDSYRSDVARARRDRGCGIGADTGG